MILGQSVDEKHGEAEKKIASRDDKKNTHTHKHNCKNKKRRKERNFEKCITSSPLILNERFITNAKNFGAIINSAENTYDLESPVAFVDILYYSLPTTWIYIYIFPFINMNRRLRVSCGG